MFFCKHVFVVHTFMHAVFLIQTSVFDNVGNVTVFYDTCIAYIKELDMNANCRVDQFLFRVNWSFQDHRSYIDKCWILNCCQPCQYVHVNIIHLLVYDMLAINTIMPYYLIKSVVKEFFKSFLFLILWDN